MDKIRVLIADDHAIVRAGVRLLLESQSDLEVVGEASNGLEAVERTKQVSPDVVLMDVAMPDMSGLEATRLIRQENPNIHILALTMHDDERYFFQLVHAGASGYVVKGASPSDLLTAIRAVYQGQAYLSPSVTKAILDDYVQRVQADRERRRGYNGLTEREREVIRLLANGLTSREIAQTLYLSPNTVERHKANILNKLGLHNRAELIKYAINKGLITAQ